MGNPTSERIAMKNPGDFRRRGFGIKSLVVSCFVRLIPEAHPRRFRGSGQPTAVKIAPGDFVTRPVPGARPSLTLGVSFAVLICPRSLRAILSHMLK